ncbi:M13 family metallopeptidase [Gulosibacter sp. 10]|uniref:M13 family metallopeptidase n=1 Tax=Gulosibacter sp. 10 TaxID=1255570 RepID=UPI00097F6576|nr:M13-type metalloendopeptidase [Gulosibacter sp. 10]SJM55088.1 Metallopeptidase [Gulosibacter sp. 10]
MTTNSVPLRSGIDIESFDEGVRPQDDLFRHVNGRWIAETEIPADKASYGSFHRLGDESEEAVRAILEESKEAEEGSGIRKAADAYAAFMDEETLARLGADPISQDVMQALVVSSIEEFLWVLGRQERRGVGGFFGQDVFGDLGDPGVNALYFEQSGLGLPDESYYREEQYEPIREAYRAHIARMLGLAEVPKAQERAERVFALETAIASHHWDVVKTREADLIYNPTTLEEFLARFEGLDMRGWMQELQAPEGTFDRFVLCQPSFADGVAGLLVEERLEQWRDWLIWRIVLAHASVLSPEIGAANFEFFGTTLQGVPEQRDRWKRGVGHAESLLGEAIGEVYVARHFKPESKAAMDDLVADLLAAYRDSIERLEWMSPATRERALEKLAKFTPKIGYPPKWRDYSELHISPRDLVGNVRRAAVFQQDWEYSKVGNPVDRELWLMTPQTVNAYYMPPQNEIVFPAAILQYPFFDVARDAAANYGAIGAVIGHEIGHGFDDQGSKYDGDGRLENWWTEEDREAFERHTASLIGQYSALTPTGLEETDKVNGEFTIGENIGDLGGLGIAWKAYQRHLDGAEAPVIDGLTGAERFFLSWAQAWREKRRPEYMKMLLAVDPHSPAEFRCNQIVRNIDVFYGTFGVEEQDALWLPPEERVTIW